MFNRVLLVVLTSAATCGLGVAAIAQSTWDDPSAGRLASDTLISQLDGTGNNADAPQSSPAIQSLQNRLTELNYYDGPVDGVFSTETRDALAAFQQDNGLVGTGILDPLTQQRLANPGGTRSPSDSAASTPDSGSGDNSGPAQAESDAPLALPPVDENGEIGDSEPSGAEENAELPAATPDSPANGADESADLADGTASSTEVAPEAATAATPATEASDDNSQLPFLIALGCIIVVSGAVGTGLILWLAKRRGHDRAESVPAEMTPVADEMPVSAQPLSHSLPGFPPPSSKPAAAAQQNGKQFTEPPSPQSSLEVQHQSMPIANPHEPRIAKVNIIDELIQDLHRSDPELRRKAIWELGQRGNSAAVQPLVDLLAEADSHEQSLVLAALAEISSQTLKPMNRAVAIALQNENSEVRKNAIRDLTRIYDSLNQVGRMLGNAAIDEDPEVRQTANWALHQLNKMRLNATDTAALLKEGEASREHLAEDGTSSHSG